MKSSIGLYGNAKLLNNSAMTKEVKKKIEIDATNVLVQNHLKAPGKRVV